MLEELGTARIRGGKPLHAEEKLLLQIRIFGGSGRRATDGAYGELRLIQRGVEIER